MTPTCPNCGATVGNGYCPSCGDSTVTRAVRALHPETAPAETPDAFPTPAKMPPYPQTDSEARDEALHKEAVLRAKEAGMTDRGEILSALRGDRRFSLGVAARVLDDEGIG